jgi:hypothetical protein
MMEIGMAALAMRVEPILRKKTNMINTARPIPINALDSTSPIALEMNVPWSWIISKEYPGSDF